MPMVIKLMHGIIVYTVRCCIYKPHHTLNFSTTEKQQIDPY